MTAADSSERQFFSHLHAFRGVAILAIVGAHCWSGFVFQSGGVGARPDLNFIYSFTETIFHGSTLFFALISGMLYTLVLRPRGFAAFFRSKAGNVILPYGVVTLFFTVLFLGYHQQAATASNQSSSFIAILVNNFVWGKGFFHLWYIPVLALVFLCTPVVNACLIRPRWRFLVVLLAVSPLVISRTEYPNLISWQTVAFFLGAYTLGMLGGEYYTLFKARISAYIIVLWSTVIITSLMLFYLTYSAHEPYGFYSFKQTVVYAQKMSAAALFLHYLSMREASPSKPLMILGTHAFSIYFFHGVFAFMVGGMLIGSGLFNIDTLNIIWLGAVNYFFAIVLSVLTSLLLGKVFGKYSRHIIGS